MCRRGTREKNEAITQKRNWLNDHFFFVDNNHKAHAQVVIALLPTPLTYLPAQKMNLTFNNASRCSISRNSGNLSFAILAWINEIIPDFQLINYTQENIQFISHIIMYVLIEILLHQVQEMRRRCWLFFFFYKYFNHQPIILNRFK